MFVAVQQQCWWCHGMQEFRAAESADMRHCV
jgi:hypothetical protein